MNIKSIAYTAGKWFDRARKFFNSTAKQGNKNVKTEQQTDKRQELIDRVERDEKPIILSLLPEDKAKAGQQHIGDLVTQGFNDGVKGRKSGKFHNASIQRARELYHDCTAHLSKLITSLEDEIQNHGQVLNSCWQRTRLHHSYQNYLLHHYKFNERGNTVGEFILYAALFVVIFIGDIPLCFETIKRLFPTYLDGGEFSLSMFAKNWEALVTAFGIASCTIYIKIWYDEFVGKKYGHSVISKKKFLELFSAEGNAALELSKEEHNAISKNAKRVQLIKSVILVFTIVVIILLGIFRRYALLKSEGVIPSIPGGIHTAALTSLTLLFSVISGVCLSISLSALTNYRRLKNCRQENTRLENEYLKTGKELSVRKGELAGLRDHMKQFTDFDRWVTGVAEIFESYYEMGYQEGLSEPGYHMQTLDFFDRVMHWRKTAVARKINSHLTILND